MLFGVTIWYKCKYGLFFSNTDSDLVETCHSLGKSCAWDDSNYKCVCEDICKLSICEEINAVIQTELGDDQPFVGCHCDRFACEQMSPGKSECLELDERYSTIQLNIVFMRVHELIIAVFPLGN